MNLLHIKRNGMSKTGEHATDVEFCELFAREMKGLYLLSLLLIANHKKAEQCFISSLEDCLKGNPVFKDWAHSWAKYMIIKNAIQMIAPRVNDSERTMVAISTDLDDSCRGTQQQSHAMTSILVLDAFERVVFVLSVLERYRDRDCALLLGCSRSGVCETRTRALWQIAGFDWQILQEERALSHCPR
jgi:hypothetical protein